MEKEEGACVRDLVGGGGGGGCCTVYFAFAFPRKRYRSVMVGELGIITRNQSLPFFLLSAVLTGVSAMGVICRNGLGNVV